MKKVSYNPVEIQLKDLLDIKRQAEILSVPGTKKSAYAGFGTTKSPFKSRGLDFQEVRVYQPGDDIRQIDWRVTAKYGKPFTKLYTEEKERCIFFICDLRKPMHFATHGDFKSVIAARMTAFLAFMASHHKDKIGALLLTDNGLINIPPDKSESNVMTLLQFLAHPKSQQAAHVSLCESAKYLGPILPSGSYLFVFSDFSDWDDKTKSEFCHFSVKDTVLLCPIYDILETKLPKGIFAFSDGTTTLVLNTDEKQLQKNFSKTWQQRLHMLQSAASSQGWGLMPIQTDDDYLNILTSFCLKGVSTS